MKNFEALKALSSFIQWHVISEYYAIAIAATVPNFCSKKIIKVSHIQWKLINFHKKKFVKIFTYHTTKKFVNIILYKNVANYENYETFRFVASYYSSKPPMQFDIIIIINLANHLQDI